MICAIHNAKKVSNTKSTRTVFAHFLPLFSAKSHPFTVCFSLHKLSHFSALVFQSSTILEIFLRLNKPFSWFCSSLFPILEGHFIPSHLVIFPQTTFSYMIIILPRKVSNRKFCGCQKIGWRFARVPIEVISLLSARKNARILRLCIPLTISDLHIYEQFLPVICSS